MSFSYMKLSRRQVRPLSYTAIASGAWRTQTLATEDHDLLAEVTLSSNQFTLQAGTYRIMCYAIAGFNPSYGHRARLQNTTDATTTLSGMNGYNKYGYSDDNSLIMGQFTIAAQKTFEIQNYVNSNCNEGAGVDTGEDYVWCIVILRKVDPAEAYALYSHVATSGTGGGTLTTGAWRTSPITTEDFDVGSYGSLASNQITLAAGTYEIFASRPINNYSSSLMYGIKTRWQNITDATTTLLSQSHNDQGWAVGRMIVLVGRFTIAAQKTFELQASAGATYTTYGFGYPISIGSEKYAQVEIRKVA